MCTDFALHDKGDGNPHAHIMLTMRPLEQSGEWGAKCRKEYDLDGRGQRIPNGKGGWENHRADTTDWNDKDKVEQWRAAWTEYANRALEQTRRPERIDHRSYKRQGKEQLPTVHMGVAATRMEQCGISTNKGNVNRQIAADNKLLKEIKVRVTRLYNWTKEQAAKPQGKESVMAQLWQARQETGKPSTQYSKVKALKESAALFNFLQANGITSMRELHEKVAAMNASYYDLRGDIRTTEHRLAVLTERLEMWAQYEQHKGTRRQLDGLKPGKREKFAECHSAELALFDTAARFLKGLKATCEPITPKQWQAGRSRHPHRKKGRAVSGNAGHARGSQSRGAATQGRRAVSKNRTPQTQGGTRPMKETLLNITITMTIQLPLPPTPPAAATMQPEDKERPAEPDGAA